MKTKVIGKCDKVRCILMGTKPKERSCLSVHMDSVFGYIPARVKARRRRSKGSGKGEFKSKAKAKARARAPAKAKAGCSTLRSARWVRLV